MVEILQLRDNNDSLAEMIKKLFKNIDGDGIQIKIDKNLDNLVAGQRKIVYNNRCYVPKQINELS